MAQLPRISAPSGALLEPEYESTRRYRRAAVAANTARAYRSGAAQFEAWATERGLTPLPASPDTVARFLADLADQGRTASTIGLRAAAIRRLHVEAKLAAPTDHPEVKAALAGIRRTLGTAQRGKAPLTAERLAAAVAHVRRDTLRGKRDAALLLLGFATACRRSELVALDYEDVEETERGLLVRLRRSKNDPEGRGHVRAVPFGRAETCPVVALREWCRAAGITEGPIFRGVRRGDRIGERLDAERVSRIVKQYAAAAGLDPEVFSGHSLRAGFITSAAERGAHAERIADHTGHKSLPMVRQYTRRVDSFADHPGDGLL